MNPNELCLFSLQAVCCFAVVLMVVVLSLAAGIWVVPVQLPGTIAVVVEVGIVVLRVDIAEVEIGWVDIVVVQAR